MPGEGVRAAHDAGDPRRAPEGKAPSAIALLYLTAFESLGWAALFAILAATGCLMIFAQVPARRAFEGHLKAAGVPTRRSGWSVAVVLAAHFGYAAAGLAGLALLHVLRGPVAGSAPAWLEMLGFGGATLGLTLALRPFVFLPFVLADGRATLLFGDALTRAADLGARAGGRFWRRFDAVFLPAFVVAPLLLFLYVPLGAMVAGTGWGVGLVVASALVASRYAELTPAGFEELPDAARTTPRALRLVGASALVASSLAGLALVAALVVPTPAHLLRKSVAALRADAAVVAVLDTAERARLPGTQVEVWAEREAIHIEASDGGGAGRVALDPGPAPRGAGALALTVLQEPSGDFLLVAMKPLWTRPRAVRVDREGVRTDDGLRRRAALRLGQLGSLALVVLLLAWLVFVLRSHRRLAMARTLHAIRDASDLGAAARPLAALDGVLQASSVVIEGRRARFDTPAHVVRGSLRVRLPAAVPLLAEGERSDGGPVTLGGRFSRLGGRGLREAALPSPDDPALVAGGRDEAARVLVAAAARQGTVALTVSLGAALVVVGGVLFALA